MVGLDHGGRKPALLLLISNSLPTPRMRSTAHVNSPFIPSMLRCPQPADCRQSRRLGHQAEGSGEGCELLSWLHSRIGGRGRGGGR